MAIIFMLSNEIWIFCSDVIEKYVRKIQSLEPDIEDIVTQEEEEKQIARTENQMNKVSHNTKI